MGLVLLGAAGLAEAPEPDPAFARELPAEVGDVSTFELVSGAFTNVSASGRYRFYVNPHFQALYQVMRYRVRFTVDGEAAPAEKLVWNRRPGQREPLVVWARVAAGGPVRWRSITPGTDEYLLEMGRLMQILSAHGAARSQDDR
jgi:hypothetical protein